MMAREIINRICLSNKFVTPKEFGEWFNIDSNKAKEVLDIGVHEGVFFVALEHGKNQSYSEYGVREVVLFELEENKVREELKRFEKTLNDYFGEIKARNTILSSKLTELKDNVLTALASRKRNRATEFIVTQIEKDNHIYTTRDDLKSEMWIYKDGIYKPQGKTFIKEFCRLILQDAYFPHAH